jgi:hypothetical protein
VTVSNGGWHFLRAEREICELMSVALIRPFLSEFRIASV